MIRLHDTVIGKEGVALSLTVGAHVPIVVLWAQWPAVSTIDVALAVLYGMLIAVLYFASMEHILQYIMQLGEGIDT